MTQLLRFFAGQMFDVEANSQHSGQPAFNLSVRCSGMVNFNIEDDVKRWIYEHNDVLSRLYTSYDQIEYFCLPIAEMDYYDLSPTPPVFQHFDLIAGQVGRGYVGERFK